MGDVIEQIVSPTLATLLIVVFVLEAFLPFISFKWAKANGWFGYWIISPILIISFLSYQIYTAIYPTDTFYHHEFKVITQKEIPKSAEVLRKSASYPGFHGDYCSAAVISLSSKDYRVLISSWKNDTAKFLPTQGVIGSEILKEVISYKEQENGVLFFQRKVGRSGHHL